jgi:hypothetical protein
MQRIRGSGLLQTLVAGREDLIGQLLRSEVVPADEEQQHERAKRTEPPPRTPSPVAPIRPARVPGVRQLLASRRSLRQAMILNEVLGPPKSLRQE